MAAVLTLAVGRVKYSLSSRHHQMGTKLMLALRYVADSLVLLQ